jgi:hypothetical protein
MKILYMASIYGLIIETKKQFKKNYSNFYEKTLQNDFEKNYNGFYGKTAAKTILQLFLR